MRVVQDRLEAIELAQIEAEDAGGGFTICHGPSYCENPENIPCAWCIRVDAGDSRSAIELENELLRQERGH